MKLPRSCGAGRPSPHHRDVRDGGLEPPAAQDTQNGYRGTAMDQIETRADAGRSRPSNVAPAPADPAEPGGPAGKAYENVKVLQQPEHERVQPPDGLDDGVGQPGAGLHLLPQHREHGRRQPLQKARRPADAADDPHINADWKRHVAATGVTCYTCHRGQPVPANIWFSNTNRNQ